MTCGIRRIASSRGTGVAFEPGQGGLGYTAEEADRTDAFAHRRDGDRFEFVPGSWRGVGQIRRPTAATPFGTGARCAARPTPSSPGGAGGRGRPRPRSATSPSRSSACGAFVVWDGTVMIAAWIVVAATWSAIVVDALAGSAGATDDTLVMLGRAFAVHPDVRPWLIAFGVALVVLAWAMVIRAIVRRRSRRASAAPLAAARSVEPTLADRGPGAAAGSITASRVAEMQVRIEELQDRLRAVLAERAALRTEVEALHRELEATESASHDIPPRFPERAERTREVAAGAHPPASIEVGSDAAEADDGDDGGEDAEVFVLEDLGGSSGRAVLSRFEARDERGEVKEPS